MSTPAVRLEEARRRGVIKLARGCRRGLDEAQCEARCCHCCDNEERLGDDALGAQCLTDLAMDAEEEQRAACRNGDCTHGCGRD